MLYIHGLVRRVWSLQYVKLERRIQRRQRQGPCPTRIGACRRLHTSICRRESNSVLLQQHGIIHLVPLRCRALTCRRRRKRQWPEACRGRTNHGSTWRISTERRAQQARSRQARRGKVPDLWPIGAPRGPGPSGRRGKRRRGLAGGTGGTGLGLRCDGVPGEASLVGASARELRALVQLSRRWASPRRRRRRARWGGELELPSPWRAWARTRKCTTRASPCRACHRAIGSAGS